MTVVLILALIATVAYFVYRVHRSIRPMTRLWRKRTGLWIRDLGTSQVDATPSRLSDFVGLGGFSLSMLAIAIGWYSIVLQTRKNALEQESRDLAAKIADKQQQIELNLGRLKVKQSDEAIHLQTPSRDAQLIGTHVDLEWNYSGHSPFLTYVVEIMNKNQSSLDEYGADKTKLCRLTQYRACSFVATDPAGQHSQIFSEQVGRLAGSYLWRVVPARRSSTGEDMYDSDRISDWSQYRAFSIFPTIRDRVMKSKRVLVGTTYTEDVRFSTLGSGGQAEGHDIDLIRILVEGCLTANDALYTLDFDQDACRNTIDQYLQLGRYELRTRPGQVRVSVKPFISVGEGLEVLGRREVDLFIGSLTKAKKRQHGPIMFTDGYFTFETKLYARKETGEQELSRWARRKPKLGVISKSSNYWLATLLEREKSLKNQITVVTFDTYPALEEAFDRGEVGGALLDDVLGQELHDATPLTGLRDTAAWASYHEDEDSLGLPREEFAIAVVLDKDDRLDANRTGTFDRLKHLLSPRSDDFISSASLYSQVQQALASDDVRRRLLPNLRSRFIDHPISK